MRVPPVRQRGHSCWAAIGQALMVHGLKPQVASACMMGEERPRFEIASKGCFSVLLPVRWPAGPMGVGPQVAAGFDVPAGNRRAGDGGRKGAGCNGHSSGRATSWTVHGQTDEPTDHEPTEEGADGKRNGARGGAGRRANRMRGNDDAAAPAGGTRLEQRPSDQLDSARTNRRTNRPRTNRGRSRWREERSSGRGRPQGKQNAWERRRSRASRRESWARRATDARAICPSQRTNRRTHQQCKAQTWKWRVSPRAGLVAMLQVVERGRPRRVAENPRWRGATSCSEARRTSKRISRNTHQQSNWNWIWTLQRMEMLAWRVQVESASNA